MAQVTFESLWSRHTHPREFPPESARAHFGEVIGASHTAQYRVWQEGRIASSGMRRLADDGSPTALEKELKAEVWLYYLYSFSHLGDLVVIVVIFVYVLY